MNRDQFNRYLASAREAQVETALQDREAENKLRWDWYLARRRPLVVAVQPTSPAGEPRIPVISRPQWLGDLVDAVAGAGVLWEDLGARGRKGEVRRVVGTGSAPLPRPSDRRRMGAAMRRNPGRWLLAYWGEFGKAEHLVATATSTRSGFPTDLEIEAKLRRADGGFSVYLRSAGAKATHYEIGAP